jgi:hypothetical protein
MQAEVSQEERILLLWFDCEVVNLPNMPDALDESGKLAKGDLSPVTTVLDHRCKGAAA